MENKRFYNPPRYILRKKLILNLLSHENIKHKKSLEIGYGSGDLLITLAKKDMQVYGYDFSELAKENAIKRISQSSIDNVTLFNKKEDIPYCNYDYLFACEVLEHIENDRETLLEWNGYLRGGGILIMSVPSRMKKWGQSDVWAGHWRRYEKKQLIQLLESAGFEVKTIWSYPFPANILLDKMLNRATQDIGIHFQDKIESSKQSGVVRKTNLLYKMLSNRYILEPVHLIQKIFVNTDLGSGYVLKAVSHTQVNHE